jgi:phosphoenolpyruvate carboxykinase (GTP)
MEQYKPLFLGNGLEKLKALDNPLVMSIVEEYIGRMKPRDVLVCDDSAADMEFVREMAVIKGEERSLKTAGHTLHYDGPLDQGRDKKGTATLLPPGMKLSRDQNVYEREKALAEVLGIMDGIMTGKTMIVCFFCLGPQKSRFSQSALQITDSFYVAHSEMILYRAGYEQFKNLKKKDDFYHFVHSAGVLDESKRTVNIKDRRIYIDPLGSRVFTVNNQYAGNSLACKKLALRLAIYRANNEDWLTEHMFLTGFSPLKGGRKTYFAGAYPSACGKTSTAMIPGGKIVGDDICYIRLGPEGEMRAVNIEQGIFGIIKDVNEQDDPLIFTSLESPKEIIFSNVLSTNEGQVFWDGCRKEGMPTHGLNHAGEWKDTDVEEKGKPVPCSHGNSRFTLRICELDNIDENLHNPDGVEIEGILYGGRDSDTSVPVAEALDWNYGVFQGACIESESTTATIGEVGKREPSPMANMDFLIVPLGKYLTNHIRFGAAAQRRPHVFQTNYFLKDADKKDYLNTKLDKKVWVLWAEGRVHNEYDGISTPIGVIPKYEDLRDLFARCRDGHIYTRKEYVDQFGIRVKNYKEKLERVKKQYDGEPNMPPEFFAAWDATYAGLIDLEKRAKDGVVSPFDL